MNHQELRARLGAQLVTPADSAYDDVRRVWNGMIDRRPSLIARCRGVADVVAAVEFAREQELLLAVRGGGHNVAGFGTCEGGLLVDLSPMRGVRVDPARRLVRAGGGATLGDVDRESQAFGLAIPGGIVSTTGVAGLTLGGGQGWLRRTFGMTCDSLVSADVVTAAGALVTASETENPELFWGLRGGGGNFGVVTSLEFRAHPVGPMIAFAGPGYPVESAQAVIAGMRDYAAAAPDSVNVSATWWTIPPLPAFPEQLHGRTLIVVGGVYAGAPEDGERVLQPLRELDERLLDLSATLPYVALQQMFDPFFPARELQYYWKSMYLAGLDRDAVATVADHVAARPSARSMIGMWALGGALGRVDPSATAAGGREAPFLLEILANWSDPADAGANIEWARTLFDAMRPYGTGTTNVNFPGLGDDAEFGRAAFGDNWKRLVEVKRTWDPTNLFRMNQNIDPTG
ncbi:MAG TPA: FAD-binding oxidoreductase [Longimicrobiales bacterium]|nr:FAD-binding oxidoreductase [Longimicrobiales bacterium]